MANNPLQINPFDQTQIALWGPSGAGKDWLFRSFAKELEYYNQKDRDFHYEVGEFQPGDADPLPLFAEPPLNIPGTPTNHDIHYLFRRIPLIQDQAHQISAQPHDIIIHNDKGADLVDSLYDQTTFEVTYQTLFNSQNIFLVLGPPEKNTQIETARQSDPQPDDRPDSFPTSVEDWSIRNSGSQIDMHSLEAARANWTSGDYLKFLRLLLHTLEHTPGRNLAVCMTKSDQLNLGGDDSWQMFGRRFGREMLRELEVHRRLHHIEVFATSAAGYLKLGGGKTSPNFQNGALRDPQRWNPVNTAAPFFWIFEQIERTRLPRRNFPFGADPQGNYIPYPSPRKF